MWALEFTLEGHQKKHLPFGTYWFLFSIYDMNLFLACCVKPMTFSFSSKQGIIHCVKGLAQIYEDSSSVSFLSSLVIWSTREMTAVSVENPILKPYYLFIKTK